MGDARPGLYRRLYGALIRLLPSEFRHRWMEGAEADLDEALTSAREARGTLAVHWAAWCALADVARALPREWWRARQYQGRRRSLQADGMGSGERMMSVINDLRLALRTLARRPGYTVAATVTLALGIGANVAIFTVVNAVLLEPLPYPDADRLVTMKHHAPALDLPTLNSSPGMLDFYRQEADFFSSLAAYDTRRRNLVGGPQPERIEVVDVSPQIFDVLRVQPALGRPFGPDDAVEGAAPVALLTHAAWTNRFGADPSVIGQTVRLDDVRTEIVGVMPAGFAFPDPDAVALTPLVLDPELPFGEFGLDAVARLAPGFTVDRADARARELQSRLTEYFPDLEQGFLDQAGWDVTVQSFQDFIVGDETESTLWIVLGTVGFVFLIACANVANLFLVRAESRQKELAVRSAMGAGYGRIARGFLSEAAILGAAGGIAGVLLAWWGVEALVTYGPQDVPRIHEVGIDLTTLGFAAVLALGASLLLGSFPLIKYAGGALASVLRDGGRGSTDGKERHTTRNVLVAAQLALALMLLVGSGLMFRSFQALRGVDPGFTTEGILTVGLSLGEGVDVEEAARFYQTVADEVAALPGVVTVGLSTQVPLGSGSSNGGSFYIESQPRDEGTLPPVAMYKAVGGEYFDAIGQPLIKGRALARSDWEGGPAVVVVNETFEAQFLDGEALGERISFSDPETGTEWAEIVGVVADVLEYGLQTELRPQAYLPMVVADWGYPALSGSYLLIRTEPGISVPVTSVRSIVEGLDPTVPLTSVRTIEEVVGDETAGISFTTILLGMSAGVALFLGAVGLFGVVSYVVSQRTREIGVRVALGARGEDIRGMVLRQGATVAVVGVVLGLLGAAALSRVMGSILFGVSTLDPFSFVLAPVVLLAVTVTATWLPARRASRVDPLEALRTE